METIYRKLRAGQFFQFVNNVGVEHWQSVYWKAPWIRCYFTIWTLQLVIKMWICIHKNGLYTTQRPSALCWCWGVLGCILWMCACP
jgi:hypothetical protein